MQSLGLTREKQDIPLLAFLRGINVCSQNASTMSCVNII